MKSKKTGPAKYKPGINIEKIERDIYKTGRPVTSDTPWKVKNLAAQ